MDNEIRDLIARLLAHRWLPRDDRLARRALADDAFRHELDRQLAACGLQLLDNPFAAYIGIGLAPEAIEPVFGGEKNWHASNMGLTRDCLALLVVIWALIILPKRERQITRHALANAGQSDMFGAGKPLPQGAAVSAGVSEAALVADFGTQLGGKNRIVNFNLGTLSRLGFIERRNKMIYEGPLLDLAIDYGVAAPRIMEGALAELLAARASPEPAGGSAEADSTDAPHQDA
jgi:hypothetical protein